MDQLVRQCLDLSTLSKPINIQIMEMPLSDISNKFMVFLTNSWYTLIFLFGGAA